MKKKSLEGGSFELKFYEGYKGREAPRAVVIGNREFKITEILDRKRAQDKKTGENREIFTCRMEGHTVKITIYSTGKFELAYL